MKRKLRSGLSRVTDSEHDLTEEILERNGFVNCGKNTTGDTIWRIKIPFYYHQIQVELGNYPPSNPNSGIVSLYSEEEKTHIWTQSKKTNKTRRRPITIKESTFSIASHVTSTRRLREIINALTSI